MKVLKDIAVEMDCHVETARRWVAKLGVPPDVRGHGANKWNDDSFALLIGRWKHFYDSRGTSPQLIRAKYAGLSTDSKQLPLIFNGNEKFFPQWQGKAAFAIPQYKEADAFPEKARRRAGKARRKAGNKRRVRAKR